ncbi:MAG: DUF3822 family protein [Bacteroidaceae bacterium]|nr:DUF3822 family protein [Bacteroidaceae bacterium]
MLTLRISSTTLSAACLEMGKPFSFTPLHLQSHRSLIANLQEAVSTTPIFKERNPKEAVQVLVVGNATPIPLSEFQEEDCDAFYNYCFKPMVPHRVFYDVVPTANLMLVFGLPESTCKAIEEVLGDVHYVSAQTPVLKQFTFKSTQSQGAQLYIYTHEKTVDIALFDNGRLLITNSYDAHSPADASYYAFNIISHHGIKPQDIHIHIAGTPELRNPLITELGKFANHVVPILPSIDFKHHEIASTEGMTYDLITFLLGRKK